MREVVLSKPRSISMSLDALMLGRGQALINQLPASRQLDHVGTTPFPSGVVVQDYRPHYG